MIVQEVDEHELPLLKNDKLPDANQVKGDSVLQIIMETDGIASDDKPEIVKKVDARKKVLARYTCLADAAILPVSKDILDWRQFNSNYYSQDLDYKEVEDICNKHWDRMIDVRPYMIETPFVAQSTDRLQKILDIFRNMHLRALPVLNPATGGLEGIITRQDIFAYMSL